MKREHLFAFSIFFLPRASYAKVGNLHNFFISLTENFSSRKNSRRVPGVSGWNGREEINKKYRYSSSESSIKENFFPRRGKQNFYPFPGKLNGREKGQNTQPQKNIQQMRNPSSFSMLGKCNWKFMTLFGRAANIAFAENKTCFRFGENDNGALGEELKRRK